MGTPALQFIKANTVAEVAKLVATARAQGRVPLVGDPRWSDEHWQSVCGHWQNADLPEGAAWAALSSGSTGNPRLIVRTESSWSDSFEVLNRLLGLAPNDVFYLPGSPASSLSVFSMAHAASLGAQIVDDSGLANATIFHGTPSLLAAMLQKLNQGARTQIRVALVGGDALPMALRDQAQSHGIRVVSYYGAAELSFVAIDTDGTGLERFEGVEVRLTDGQLWVKSPYRAIGYLGDGGALAEDLDGWVTVGDLATMEAGKLKITGRADGAIQTAGTTVIPQDVESALMEIAGISQAVVFAWPSAAIGNLVAAVLVFDGDGDGETAGAGEGAVKGAVKGEATSVRALIDACNQRLNPTHRPRLWFKATKLPETISGKPARKQIQTAAILGEYKKLD